MGPRYRSGYSTLFRRSFRSRTRPHCPLLGHLFGLTRPVEETQRRRRDGWDTAGTRQAVPDGSEATLNPLVPVRRCAVVPPPSWHWKSEKSDLNGLPLALAWGSREDRKPSWLWASCNYCIDLGQPASTRNRNSGAIMINLLLSRRLSSLPT